MMTNKNIQSIITDYIPIQKLSISNRSQIAHNQDGSFNRPTDEYIANAVWYRIPSYEDYAINTDGYIISFKCNKSRFMVGGIDKDKYIKGIGLTNDKGVITKMLHQVMAYVFLDYNINNKSVVIDHINQNPIDNRLENLRLVSHSENLKNRKKFNMKKRPYPINPSINLNIQSITDFKNNKKIKQNELRIRNYI